VSAVTITQTPGAAAEPRPTRTTRPDRPSRRSRQVRVRSLHRPVLDVALALAWLPFAVVTHGLQTGGSPGALAGFMAGVFLLSFAHQPLTVALVYGDPAQFRLRRAIFTWTPLILAVAVVIGFYVSFALVAIIGGLWNVEHTLMQRYGVTRIYGRKAGQDDGLVEKAMLLSWLALAMAWVAADPATPGRVASIQFGENNRVALEALVAAQPVARFLVIPAAVAVVVIALRWWRDERARAEVNPLKWFYLASTAAIFVLILVDPLAGLMGYVGAHAVEYFVIVHQSLGRRYGRAADTGDGGAPDEPDRSWLGRAVRARPGRIGFLAIYVGIVIAIITGLERARSPLAYTVVFFTLGGMHVFYDGFIWKLRRPVVADSLAIPHS
jgi:hypothetical protein